MEDVHRDLFGEIGETAFFVYYYNKANNAVLDNLEDQNEIGVLINCETNEKGKIIKAEIKKYETEADEVETEDEYESENDNE